MLAEVKSYRAPVGANATTVFLDTQGVNDESDRFLAQAKKFAERYTACTGYTRNSDRQTLLRKQTIISQMDDFILHVARREIVLPDGVEDYHVIGPAVAEFIKLGVPYTFDTGAYHAGCTNYSARALKADGTPDWHVVLMNRAPKTNAWS